MRHKSYGEFVEDTLEHINFYFKGGILLHKQISIPSCDISHPNFLNIKDGRMAPHWNGAEKFKNTVGTKNFPPP